MSNKRALYFLLLVSCAYAIAGSGIAYGQSTATFSLVGTVKEVGSNPVGPAEYTVAVDESSFIPRNDGATDDDGAYGFSFLDFTGGTVSVGDELTLTAVEAATGSIRGTVVYTVTVEDVTASPAGASVDILLSGVSITATPASVFANGTDTSDLTIVVQHQDGTLESGDAPIVTAPVGTVSPVENVGDGTYTAVYTAPSLDFEGSITDTISVTSIILGESAETQIALEMIPAETPPAEVNILVISGTVYQHDGVTPVSGATVDVSVADLSQSAVTEAAGTYNVTFLNVLEAAATAGDAVSIVATDSDGLQRGALEFVLANEDLGALGSASLERDVITDIKEATSLLAVSGTVFLIDGETLATAGVSVLIENSAQSLELSAVTEENGTYAITFFNPLEVVAETGDRLILNVSGPSDQGDVIDSVEYVLTAEDIEAKQLSWDAVVDLTPEPTTLLVVDGLVRNPDGSLAGAGISVSVSLIDSTGVEPPREQAVETAANGTYTVTFFDPIAPVAGVAHSLYIEAQPVGLDAYTHSITPVSSSNVLTQRATVDLDLLVYSPDSDHAQISVAAIDDQSALSDDELTIYSDSETVQLAVTILNRSEHPLQSVVVQISADSDEAGWTDIATLQEDDLDAPVLWTIDNFEALIAIAESVRVRAVATNVFSLVQATAVVVNVPLSAAATPLKIGTEITEITDGTAVVEANDDGVFILGGLMAEGVEAPMAVFTVKPADEVDRVAGVNLLVSLRLAAHVPGDAVELESTVSELPDADGAYTVTVADLGELGEGGEFLFQAVAVDATGVAEAVDLSYAISVNVVNETIPVPGPEVIALEAVSASSNAESDAVQGSLTLRAFTESVTAPDVTAVQFQIKRRGAEEWSALGEATESTLVDEPTVDDLLVILESILESIVDGDESEADAPDAYRLWILEDVDTTLLEDTIPQRHHSEEITATVDNDENPYVVRAVALDSDATEYIGGVGATVEVSVHNLPPIAPLEIGTQITAVNDVAGAVSIDEDGRFQLGGVVSADVAPPAVTLTVAPAADASRVSGVRVLFNARNADGSMGEPVHVEDQSAELVDGLYTVTIPDVSVLTPDGEYIIQAVAIDALGVGGILEEQNAEFAIVANVVNFVPPSFADVNVLSVGGRSVAETIEASPSGVLVGSPATTAQSFSFQLQAAGLITGDIDVLVDDVSARANGHLEVAAVALNRESAASTLTQLFTITVDTSTFEDGAHALAGRITKRNGSVAFALPGLFVDRTPPIVNVLSPLAGHEVSALLTLHTEHSDGAGSGIDSSDAAAVEVELSRLAPPDEIEMTVEPSQIAKNDNGLVYTRTDALEGGAYRAHVRVTDRGGNTGTASSEFTVVGSDPPVPDSTPPSISQVSPLGVVTTADVELSFLAFDEQSGVTEVSIALDGDTPIQGATRSVTGLTAGAHTATAFASNGVGLQTDFSWTFTVEITLPPPPPPPDVVPPTIVTNSPQGLVREERPRISASATDESGIRNIDFRVFDSALRQIPAGTETFDGTTSGFFIPEGAMANGTYTVAVDVTDNSGNVTKASWSFTLEADNAPPVIGSISPQGLVRDKTPRITVSVTDDVSGVESVDFRVFDSNLRGIPGIDTFEGGTTAFFTPLSGMRNDTYTVGVNAIDKSGNLATTTWSFTLEADDSPPVIGVTSPQGIVRDATPRISAAITDDLSGIRSVDFRVFDSDVRGIAGIDTFEGGTTAYFTPLNPMRNGTYTVGINVTDKSGNLATTTWSFTVEVDKMPPVIASVSPEGIIRPEGPIISASASDDLSGIGTMQITLRDAELRAIAGRTVFEGGTSANFVPDAPLAFGTYYVAVRATDKSGNLATANWSFTVESQGGAAVLDVRNYPNPFSASTKLSFTLTRQANVNIQIFDLTLRPVRVLQNGPLPAGPVNIAWDAKSGNGEALARGVYFCQIIVQDDLRSEHRVLKMALTGNGN